MQRRRRQGCKLIPPPRHLLVVLAILMALGVVGFWAFGTADDGAKASVEVVRWGNVTVQVDRGSGVNAVSEFAPAEIKPPDGGQVLLLVKGESRIAIDADTGDILEDSTREAERQAIEQVLSTLTIDTDPPKAEAWPYGGDAPSTPRESWGKITFLLPDPASGITVILEIGDTPEGCVNAIQLTNGRSTLSINADTGEVYDETTKVEAEDKEAFDRFFSAIEHVDSAR